VEDLSLHILDIVENAIRAQAQHVRITVREDRAHDLVTIEIEDDGAGMTEDFKSKVLDPFTTTKKTSRIGLGLPLFEQAAKMCDGDFSIFSEKGTGTKVHATFRYSHIDRKPMGKMSHTLLTLIAGNPAIDISYTHTCENTTVHFDTQEWKRELDGVPINNPEVLRLIKKELVENLGKIGVL
jgi:anti-sigma regulatory factor (Ser/Thr protein kinase)